MNGAANIGNVANRIAMAIMAAETLVAIGDGSVLFDSAQPVKIGRDAVKRIVRQTSLRAWRSAWFKRRFAFLAERGTRKCDGARLDAT